MPSETRRHDALNLVSGFIAAYGWLSFFCFFYLDWRWAKTASPVFDPDHGSKFFHNEHGSITYFSAFQSTSCAILFWTSIPIFFVAILISPKNNVIVKRGFLSAGARWDRDDPRGLQLVGAAVGALTTPLIVFLLGPHLVGWLNKTGVIFTF